MREFLWDGPEDSDEEVEDMLKYKSQAEKDLGIRFSKKGIVKFIESFLAQENPKNTKDPKNAKLWEEKFAIKNGISMFLKKGGSHLSSSQPFMRIQTQFPKKYKINKMLKVVYNPEIQASWDKNMQSGKIIDIHPGKKSYGMTYSVNKK